MASPSAQGLLSHSSRRPPTITSGGSGSLPGVAGRAATLVDRGFGWLQLAGQLGVVVYSVVIAPLTGVWSLGTGLLVVLGTVVLLLVAYRPEVLRPGIWPVAALAFALA